MSLFSFLRKNKQESTSDNGEFYSRAEEAGSKTPARAKRKQGNPNADPVDHAVPEKKRARRRLVGAVALVLAAIIGLPMILDSEQKPLSNDIAIQIPSKDTPVASASGESPPVAASSSISSSETASLDTKEEIIEPAVQPQAKSEKSSIPIKGLVAPVDSAAAKTDGGARSENSDKTSAHEKIDDKEKLRAELKPGVAPKAEPKVEPKTEPKTEPKAAKKLDDAARARAILEGDTAALVPEKKQSRFVIQVAALATQDKVNDLQGKLKEAGIKSYTQKIATASGERIRIRVGPFVNKEEADKVRAKLGKLGLNGTLVPV